jgi:hypothetical protein
MNELSTPDLSHSRGSPQTTVHAHDNVNDNVNVPPQGPQFSCNFVPAKVSITPMTPELSHSAMPI